MGIRWAQLFGVLLACVLWCVPPVARADAGAVDAVFAKVRSAELDAALALLRALPEAEAGKIELRYLAARLHEKRGRYAEALQALPADLGGLPADVIADAKQRRASWLARERRCAEAKPLFAELLSGTQAADTSLVFAAAGCALDGKAASTALTYLDKLGSSARSSVPAQLLRARALTAKGDRKTAVSVLREACLQSPGHPRADEAQRMLERLSPKTSWTDDERMTRAENLTKALRPSEAIAELDRLRAPKAKGTRARALHLRGMALFQMRTRYAEAAKVLDLAGKQGGPEAASDLYHAARALARADRDAEAVKAFRAFVKRYPGSAYVQDATFTAAWLELRHEMPGGEANMRAHLDAIPKGDREALQSALWELADYLFDHGRHADALPLFERYAATSSDTMVRARGLYWAGRAALLAGQRDHAIQRYFEALREEPLHWYHVLARQRLLQLDQFVPAPFSELPPEPEVTPEPVVAEPGALPLPETVKFYARLGLEQDALDALRSSEGELRKSLSSIDGLLALIATYHSLDEHARPYRLVEHEGMGVFMQRPQGRTRIFWDALFPRPYAEHVRAASAQEQLPEDFVYSIMRKESAYDPSVVSRADAMGLLQLIEPTARTMARSAGVTPFSRARLFVPEINIRLGAHYLAKLRKLYDGQYIPAIAAYNAGEHRVNGWLARARKREGERVELDRFVEDIPFDQTRNYVRRVIANWVRYRYLQDPSAWPLELPEHLVVSAKP